MRTKCLSLADRLATVLKSRHAGLKVLREGDRAAGLVARVQMQVMVGDDGR